ncbi:hypothetical protein DFH08DRAFT_1034281 [Mycena albidolilacea]|uniref:Uncharacterized protein n=1 Tax=Mycena albidolilacea TaxID=1033008 RepID=A0AAD6ZGG2_9AGAR|nr:hypothetical protein DFH08DRAFT_1034281 [Mycena albidolilacea]
MHQDQMLSPIVDCRLRSVVEELGVVKFIKRVDLDLAAAFCVVERNIRDLVGIDLHKKQVFECHVLPARLVIVVQECTQEGSVSRAHAALRRDKTYGEMSNGRSYPPRNHRMFAGSSMRVCRIRPRVRVGLLAVVSPQFAGAFRSSTSESEKRWQEEGRPSETPSTVGESYAVRFKSNYVIQPNCVAPAPPATGESEMPELRGSALGISSACSFFAPVNKVNHEKLFLSCIMVHYNHIIVDPPEYRISEEHTRFLMDQQIL